jgi:hypothetical protein
MAMLGGEEGFMEEEVRDDREAEGGEAVGLSDFPPRGPA